MKKLLTLFFILTSTLIYSQTFIDSYPTATPVDGDKLLGTSAAAGSVKNYTVSSISTKIQSDAIANNPGTTVLTFLVDKLAATPIATTINALTQFTVAYDQIVIFTVNVTDAVGAESYILKLPKGTYGVGGTQLTADDIRILNPNALMFSGPGIEVAQEATGVRISSKPGDWVIYSSYVKFRFIDDYRVEVRVTVATPDAYVVDLPAAYWPAANISKTTWSSNIALGVCNVTSIDGEMTFYASEPGQTTLPTSFTYPID